MEKIRILVVDDHPIIGEGLEFLLNLDPGLQVLGTARSGRKGVEQLKKLNPDVVLLDWSMPELSGFEAIQVFHDVKPNIKIVIFTAHTEERFVHQALRAGAHGYVIKGSPTDELKQAIHYVWNGGYWVSPRFSQSVIETFLRERGAETGPRSSFDQLSHREQQVFRLMVDGKSTEEISELLCISVNTVAKHRISLMGKLGLKNVVDMTRFAIRNGIVDA